MRIIILFFFLSVFTCLQATTPIAAPETEVASKISDVTVFLKGAQVFREARTSIAAGQSILRFKGLPAKIDPKSIQVKGEGSFTILGVQHEVNYTEKANLNEDQQALLDAIKALDFKTEDNHVLLSTLQEEEKLLLANRAIGGSNTGVNISELKAAASFYSTRLLTIKQEILKLNRANKLLASEAQQLRKQLDQLRGEEGKYSTEVLVTCNAASSTTGFFVLSYLVNSAGWFANYDLRVKDISSPVNLDYKASVFQSSGEDWEKVNLILSTGNPFESGTKPSLAPWRLAFYQSVALRGSRGGAVGYYVDGVRVREGAVIKGRVRDRSGETLIGANVVVRGSTSGAVTDYDGQFTLTLPPNAKSLIVSYVGYESIETSITGGFMEVVLDEGGILEEVVVTGLGRKKRYNKKDIKAEKLAASPSVVPTEIVERTTTVNFVIDLPYDILSSGKQTKVQIEEYDLPAQYQYYAAPKLDLDAFLTAEVVGWEDYDLLSGEANLFFEGTYLGKSYLDVNAVEDTLDISLGRDKNIVIERVRQKDFSKKQFLGDKRTDSRSWTIEVRNKKRQPINLILEDQFPTSTDSQIEVKNGDYSRGELEEESGKITWELAIAGSSSDKVAFDYTVKYPKKKRVQLE